MSQEEVYDPNAPEGDSRPGSKYVSRKDAKVVAIALVFLAIFLYPVYRVLERRSQKTKCITNMKAIMDAINQYAIQNEDKYPPLFDTGSNNEPMLQSAGAPFTWASNLKDYLNQRASFVCPSSDPSERSRSQDPNSSTGSFPLSYGMFAPFSTYSPALVDNPNEAILVAETTNRGALNTYDPVPYKDAAGNVLPYDGMSIGWDNDNFEVGDSTKYVTRLAFPSSAGPHFTKDGEGRHDEGTFVLTVTGQLRTVKPPFAQVLRRPKQKTTYGAWVMPLATKRP